MMNKVQRPKAQVQVEVDSSANSDNLFHQLSMSFQLPQGFKPAAPPTQGQQGGGGDNGEAQEKLRQQEEMKRGMIASMLSTAARERCKFILGEEIDGADGSIEDSIDQT